ncbi:MAG: M3 family metallopeptidase [Patescibacteria group bacterium]
MSSKQLLEKLNSDYARLHAAFENAFWDLRMGIVEDGKKMNDAEAKRSAFRSNKKLKAVVETAIKKAKGVEKKRLQVWSRFFGLYQVPDYAVPIRAKVAELEEKVLKVHSTRKEGYIDPKIGSFVEASRNRMRAMMRTNPDEATRKACFEALEKLPLDTLDDFVEIIKCRNEYAQVLGYEDFYDYKIHLDEGMTKNELFEIFDQIYEKTKYAFGNIKELEKEKPGLRKPWNFGYMMTGDFTREEDPYFPFKDSLLRWGRSFSALGVDFRGGELRMDLLDRKGKWDNGFCHYPTLVRYDEKGKILPGSANFTSNTVLGQLGSGMREIHTVFHEAGHAADRLNSIQKDVCLNTEYPPSTVSWSETQSMFMDSISSSIEWKMRYAKNKDGDPYPFDLFERKIRAVHPLLPLDMMSIMFVMNFERAIYECKNLTREFILETAKEVYRKYSDKSEDSISILNVPHIYSWESSAYYHGYGLAELGVAQWREYFLKKYGYIVDNPNVGKEMTKVWKHGSLYTSGEFIKMATGKPRSAETYIKQVTRSVDEILSGARKKISRLNKVPLYIKPVKLNAKIALVHGKQKIADNKKSFEEMEVKYKEWLKSLK